MVNDRGNVESTLCVNDRVIREAASSVWDVASSSCTHQSLLVIRHSPEMTFASADGERLMRSMRFIQSAVGISIRWKNKSPRRSTTTKMGGRHTRMMKLFLERGERSKKCTSDAIRRTILNGKIMHLIVSFRSSARHHVGRVIDGENGEKCAKSSENVSQPFNKSCDW